VVDDLGHVVLVEVADGGIEVDYAGREEGRSREV
jgi:hypothetical protein